MECESVLLSTHFATSAWAVHIFLLLLPGANRRILAMETIDDMEFEWDEREQQFLRVFLGKILKRPYAAAWNTWHEMVQSQKLYEEQQRKNKIIKRMSKVLDNQVPGKRDDKGMQKIKTWALEVHGDIFLKLKPDELRMACQYMEMTRYKKSQIICLQGHPGQKYMINAQGLVAVHVDMDPVNTQRKIQIYKVKGYDYMTRMIDENPLFIGKEVSQIDAGKGFGEIALFSDQSLRTASIIAAAEKETKIISIPKEVYMNTLCKYHMTAYESKMKMEYLGKHPMLSDWSQRRIADLSFIVEKKDYAKNAILVHQGKAPAGVWFIKKGELKCVYYFKPSELTARNPMDNIEQTFTKRKRKSRNFQKAKLKLPLKYFALKQSNAPYRELAIISAEHNPIVGGQLLITDQDEHTSPFAYVVSKDIETYFIPLDNISTLRAKGRGTKITSTLLTMYKKQISRYEKLIGERVNANVYGSRANPFKLPFAKKQKTVSGPQQNLDHSSVDDRSIVDGSSSVVSSLTNMKSLDDIADWHMSRVSIDSQPSFLPQIGGTKSKQQSRSVVIEDRSSWKPKSKQKLQEAKPGVEGVPGRSRIGTSTTKRKKNFSRRSLALDRALDKELERHLVEERKRLGVS